MGKIGVRELYQKALFCHQNQLGSSSLHFIKDKRTLIHADKKQLFDGSLSKEPIFFLQCTQWELQISERFSACSATDYATGADASGSATLLRKGEILQEIAPDFQALCTLRLPVKSNFIIVGQI